jgi:hypothetical protein
MRVAVKKLILTGVVVKNVTQRHLSPECCDPPLPAGVRAAHSGSGAMLACTRCTPLPRVWAMVVVVDVTAEPWLLVAVSSSSLLLLAAAARGEHSGVAVQIRPRVAGGAPAATSPTAIPGTRGDRFEPGASVQQHDQRRQQPTQLRPPARRGGWSPPPGWAGGGVTLGRNTSRRNAQVLVVRVR